MRTLVLVLALVCAAAPVHADTIKSIVVEKNTKTTADTVIFIADIEPGDEWSAEKADLVKARLVTSGLFKDVDLFWDNVQGGVRVHLIVRDKHSWIIAPAFYNQPTNTGAGIGYGENNLFGQNQKLLLYAQLATGDSFFVGAWVIPSIGGTHFYAQLDTYDKYSRNIEYASPTKYLEDPKPVRESRLTYLNAGVRLGWELWRGVKLDTRLRAAHVGYSDVRLADGVTVDQVSPGQAEPLPPGKEGWDISNEIAFTLDHRANWYGVQSGSRYQVSYEHSILSDDFHYWEVYGNTYNAKKILDRHNLVFKTTWGYGHHLPFQQEFLTGGTSMRGWKNNQYRGDLRVLANLEYSVPLFTIKGLSFRGLGFWDSAYTTFLTTSNPERNYLPEAQARGLAPFKNSVGVGTRLFLRQIVLPLLGLDVGYGLEAGDVRVYLAIGLTD